MVIFCNFVIEDNWVNEIKYIITVIVLQYITGRKNTIRKG